MFAGPGRPKTACNTCKGQKIRCSGERPSCNRCVRLRHNCVYNSRRPISKRGGETFHNPGGTSQTSQITAQEGEHTAGIEALKIGKTLSNARKLLPHYLAEEYYVGIPISLVSKLVELYFDNVYNARLLLHKRLFIESIRRGTVRPHVVLSVCAWGANFHRDNHGQTNLKEDSYMIEWAKRAGRLVFQEAEDLHEDNIVTFFNLALFWHSQGSWRISQLHRGNAYQLLHIIGLGSEPHIAKKSLDAEIRCRRFWACYLMHCYSSEKLLLFQPISDVESLEFPWPEEDFDAGVSTCPSACLRLEGSNGGVFGELIKGLTFWSSVVSSVKSLQTDSLGSKVTNIHTLDEKISTWWRRMRPEFKLTPSNIAALPHDALPKILLINLVYHQSICALHASIVPLFCWCPGDDTWGSARQLSAQVAFEHACEASALINTVVSDYPLLSAMPSFVAYAAYCGCAVQIPFMWCTNSDVKKRVQANVQGNIKMIHAMSAYWAFATLLKKYVRCLYSFHKRQSVILEGEPKNIDPSKLTNHKINFNYTRTSILEFTGILRVDGGYAKAGEGTKRLEIEDDQAADARPFFTSPPRSDMSSTATVSSSRQHDYSTNANHEQTENYQDESYPDVNPQERPEAARNLESPLTLDQQNAVTVEGPRLGSLDVFNLFFDSEMLDLPPIDDLLDFSRFEMNGLDFGTEDWDNMAVSNDQIS